MKNVQVRCKIYTSIWNITYYPRSKYSAKIFIGCQSFNDYDMLRFLAYKLKYDLNFCKSSNILINDSGFEVDTTSADAKKLFRLAGKTLFHLICDEKGIEIK